MAITVSRGITDIEDLLVCGSCRRDFPLCNIVNFVDHKRFDCADQEITRGVLEALACQSCPRTFGTPWSLLQHAQNVHALKIYLEQWHAPGDLRPTIVKDFVIDRDDRFKSSTLAKTTLRIVGDDSRRDDVENIQPLLAAVRNTNIHDPTVSQLSVGVAESGEPEGPSLSLAVERTSAVANETIALLANKNTRSKNLTVTRSIDEFEQNKEATRSEETVAPSNTSTTCVGFDQAKQVQEVGDDDEESTTGVTEKVNCTDRACGALLPHTHARLKKCCSSVVPKKRKRHMETKHLRGRRSRRVNSEDDDEGRDTNIYIDVEDDCAVTFEPGGFDDKYARDGSSGVDRGGEGSTSVKRSVIIEPGMTYSTVVSYSKVDGGPGDVSHSTRVMSAPIATTSFAGSASRRIVDDLGTLDSWKREFTSGSDVSTDEQVSKVQGKRRLFKVESEGKRPGEPAGSGCDDDESQYLFQSKEGGSGGVGGEESHGGEDEGERLDNSQGEWSVGLGSVEGQKRRRYPTTRPFKCEECSDAFNQRIHLRKHQSKHTGVKPFKCDRCDYSTVERSHLKVHIRVHTGEKPFKCTSCEYATAQNSTLKIHLKRRHHLQDNEQEQS